MASRNFSRMMPSTISESPLQGGGAPLPSKPSCIGDFDFTGWNFSRSRPEADMPCEALSTPAASKTAGYFSPGAFRGSVHYAPAVSLLSGGTTFSKAEQ